MNPHAIGTRTRPGQASRCGCEDLNLLILKHFSPGQDPRWGARTRMCESLYIVGPEQDPNMTRYGGVGTRE